MTPSQKKTLTVFAPAKINLYLHITGRQNSGYHNLDSLVTFADIGDTIMIETAPSFSFHVIGPFADSFSRDERNTHIDGENIVIRAARSLAQITDNALNLKITLKKVLPISAGLGGGSSDAAATIWGLQELWQLPRDANYLIPLMTKLGADVPVCLNCQPTIMQGIGDILKPAPRMPEIPMVLINPMVSCPTADVFLRHSTKYKKEDITLPKNFQTVFDLTETLHTLDNDLLEPAIETVPEIENVISALRAQNTCLLSRMSGSGASCFGLFETMEAASHAADAIMSDNPDWWVKTAWLNRPERY